MAHFAELDENNIVTRVLVVNNEDILDGDGQESESVGVSFLQNMFGSDSIWKQCSYNNNMRFRYPSIGYSYNETLDAFIAPRPYDSWVLNESTTKWESPIGHHSEITDDMRSDGTGWFWDEDAYQADNTTGWVIRSILL